MSKSAKSIIQGLIAERDKLKAEIEALRKDAERYRWLREKGGATFSFGSGKRCTGSWYEVALAHAMENEK